MGGEGERGAGCYEAAGREGETKSESRRQRARKRAPERPKEAARTQKKSADPTPRWGSRCVEAKNANGFAGAKVLTGGARGGAVAATVAVPYSSDWRCNRRLCIPQDLPPNLAGSKLRRCHRSLDMRQEWHRIRTSTRRPRSARLTPVSDSRHD